MSLENNIRGKYDISKWFVTNYQIFTDLKSFIKKITKHIPKVSFLGMKGILMSD